MLKLSSADYQALRHHGEETYPHECCGILLGAFEGDARAVHATIRCTNIAKDSPQSRYDIDPRELVQAQREAASRGSRSLGSTIPIPIIRLMVLD